MRIIFIVQGEGRGHQMQSAALKEIIERHGHDLIRVFEGTKPWTLWSHDRGGIPGDSTGFLSPYFISKKNGRGLNLWLTFLINIIFIPAYVIEMIRIGILIRKLRPDMIINFYDIVGSLASIFSGTGVTRYTISHHFFFEHPDFAWPVERKFERGLLLLHSVITSFTAHKKLALSFTASKDIPEKRLYIIPPLLRKEILNAEPSDQGFILVYTLYPGFYHEIKIWCRDNPGKKVKMFSQFTEIQAIDAENFEVNCIDGSKFMDALKTCSMVSCTAGFETLAEAAFLGKRLVVVPTGSHFEQLCNAVDLERAGLGSSKKSMIPFPETDNQPEYLVHIHPFRDWVLKAEELVLFQLGLK